jgi:glycine/D-amino acid oxidase-like deaminating enzyme
MAEITVYGAGIFGLSVAWACCLRGARVRVVDPTGPASGASGGLVGALAPHTPENWNSKKRLQFQSLDAAEIYWRDIEATGGVAAGFGRIGRLQPVPDARALDLARARAVSARELWQGRYVWEVVAQDRFAGLLTSATGYLIHDTLSARLHPRRAVAALVAALSVRGVAVTPEAPTGPAGIEVWATGAAGLAALSAEMGRTVGTGVKGQAALLAADLRGMPQIYADGVHIVPHADGTTAIGSTSERAFNDPTATDAQLESVIARARGLCPALASAPVQERWAGLRPRARSRAPMVGPHPSRPGVYIANGGFKIGFGVAPMVADLLADLILEGRDAIPPEFRPEASLPQR